MIFAQFTREQRKGHRPIVGRRAVLDWRCDGATFAGTLVIVAAREVLFEPDVEADEKVAAAHLADLQLGDARAAVSPSDGNRGPGVSSDNRLQRKLDREVKVRGNQRATSVNYSAAVRLKGIGRVVQSVAEEELEEQIGHSVQE